jgi:ribosomal silencing factor RsfS
MFDPKCEELARHFLVEHGANELQIQALADEIQDAIETWMFAHGIEEGVE